MLYINPPIISRGYYDTSNVLLFIIKKMPFQIEELDLPVSNNQDLIVKNFCHFQDSFCHDIVGKGQDLQPKRMKILRAVRQTKIDNELLDCNSKI